MRSSRFIPAGAGNTYITHSSYITQAVHPRGRGEHSRRKRPMHSPYGSSPRARGTREWLGDLSYKERFIPAGAGNTWVPADPNKSSAVHPRGRGEHCNTCSVCPVDYGSSPRARGTLCLAPGWRLVRRFIPAGAGNTSDGQRQGLAVPVHPRGRGEHWSAEIVMTMLTGSSPRARGTRLSRLL